MLYEKFEKVFAATDHDGFILEQLVRMMSTVTLKNGHSYEIENVDDLRAMVKKEVYEQYFMTGENNDA